VSLNLFKGEIRRMDETRAPDVPFILSPIGPVAIITGFLRLLAMLAVEVCILKLVVVALASITLAFKSCDRGMI